MTAQPTLHIFRGLPGSGKTTAANKIGCLVISPQDMYSVVGGVYDFHGRIGNDREASRNARRDAKAWAMNIVWRTLVIGCDVAVAEVLPRLVDVKRWDEIGRAATANIRVVDMPCNVATAKARNIHNVPDEVIEDMAAAWEPWEGDTE
jgi:hypothetical protein